jgi:predicted dehydrogenase
LAACCDLDAERQARFVREFGIRGYSDAAEMIRVEKPDLIHLVTGPRLRVELMSMVHEQRVPACIVEKPIACEVRDWRALVELEAASETRFGVNAQVRYNPRLAHCREALRSGKLGEVRFLDCSAGGTIADQGVHVIDWAMSLNDDQPVVRVFGAASGDRDLTHPMHPSPDTTVAKLDFANGVRGLWNLGWSAPQVLDKDAYYVHLRVAAYAERGHVLFEQFGRWEIVSPDGTESGWTDFETWTDVDTVAQASFTNAMFDWLEDGGSPPGTNLKRSLEQWNVVLGLYASTVCRRPIDIPFDPPDDLWARLGDALQ